jgi:hypothetical protein
LETLDEYPVEWGDKKFLVEEKWCKWAEVQHGNTPTAKKIADMAGLYDIYVRSASTTEIEKHIKRVYREARKLAKGSFKKFKKEFDGLVNAWKTEALTQCMPDGIKHKYAVLPVKVQSVLSQSLLFQVPVEFFSIGNKTSYGFEYLCTSPGIKGIKGNEKGFDGKEGFVDAYLTKEYGDLYIHAGSDTFSFSSQLEALLE